MSGQQYLVTGSFVLDGTCGRFIKRNSTYFEHCLLYIPAVSKFIIDYLSSACAGETWRNFKVGRPNL